MADNIELPKLFNFTLYGIDWANEITTPLHAEFAMIRAGGYMTFDGEKYGLGLFHHMKEAISILWPEDDHHRWSDLMLETMCAERVTVVQGPRDCSKTRTLAKWALVDYWSSPENTMTIMTSTGIRELELRVWGDIKGLYQRAKDKFPWLAGNINQANHGIFTDSLEDRGDLRVMTRGLICVPCLTGEGQWTGLSNFVGIKQKRRRLIGDELQFIPVQYVNTLDAFDKGDFKGAFLGNPIGGNGKALDKIAEPLAGWSSLGEIPKTTTWKNKYGGVTVQLVGTDSPNFDSDRTKKLPYLIDQDDIDKVALRNGKDSAQFWTLILGVRKIGADAYRVLTVEMCERSGAFNTVIWRGTDRTKIYGLDAGYGGDPCEVEVLEFGEDVSGAQVIDFSTTRTIPVNVSSGVSAEDQIALFVKSDAARLGVPDENIFFEAGMRATLAISMARIISPSVNAVNAGGSATDRPLDEDTFISDPKTKQRRIKTCAEQYSKFVTEMWYSVREVVEARQARSFPKAAAEEFQNREWRWVPGPLGERYELETKPEYKARNSNQSPNKADVTSIAVEGARRLGFVIKNEKEYRSPENKDEDWLQKEVDKHRAFQKRTELTYK